MIGEDGVGLQTVCWRLGLDRWHMQRQKRQRVMGPWSFESSVLQSTNLRITIMRKAGIVPSSLEASYESITQSRQDGMCDGNLTDVQVHQENLKKLKRLTRLNAA